MKKKPIIGIMLVLALLLLMPSIPAIQNKSIKEKTSDIHFQKPYDVSIKDKYWKFPLLYLIVRSIFVFRLSRASFLFEFSTDVDYSGMVITHPLIFLRSMWLMQTGSFVYFYLEAVFGWNR
jgi:hypothetical protein